MRVNKKAVALSALLVLPLLGGVAAGAVIPAGTNGPGLASVGPVSATDGYPVWYKDKTGLRLTNCVAAADPLCPARGPLPDETAPVSFPDNYPDEGFYMLANANLATANGGKALAVVALEQAFSAGPVVDGEQVTFGRVRFKITNAKDGVDYKITSPAGVKTLQTSKPGLVFDTEDIGIGSPSDFTGALGGRVGPFLTWDTFPTDPALAPVAGKDTYIGDGATLHKITGSPYGSNIFRIEGPGINPSPTVDACPTVAGPAADCLETDLFTLQGKLATTSGVTAEQATYSRSSTSAGLLDVYATSEADSSQSIQVTDANATASAREFSTTGLAGSAGHYFARVAYTGAQPPAKVQVSNIGDVPVTNKVISVIDRVTGKATYDTGSGDLTVNAVSSDTASPRVLTATGYGNLTGGSLVVPALSAPPVSVTVTSDAGGSVTLPVDITGGARAPIPVVAQAGPDQGAIEGQTVTLDGSASSGDVTTYAWTSPSGIALSDPTSAKPTFTAPPLKAQPTPDSYTFTLTVNGPGGPSSATVTVTVTGLTTATANAGTAQTAIQRGTKVTLDGTKSTGAATYTWTQVTAAGDPTVTLTGTATASPTFTFPLYKFPANTGALTFKLVVSNSQGTSPASTVTVTPKADTVAITAARYTVSKKEWRIDGTSSILAGQTVTAHLGPLSGPVLGTAVVDATGAYSVRSTTSTSVGAAGQTVSVESPIGGTAAGFAVRLG
jgi:hypothetical protein